MAMRNGMELPSAADPVAYSVGFVLATGLLHVSGICLGLLNEFPRGIVATRSMGGIIAVLGVLVSISGNRHMRGGIVPPASAFPGARPRTRIHPPPCLGTELARPLGDPRSRRLGARAPDVAGGAFFFSCWLSVIVTAASVHLGRGLKTWAAVALSLNAAVWASAVVSLSGSKLDLLKALPCVLILLPASWVVRRYASIPVKVVSSWIIAVAVLAATLQLLPVTPGYLPDHLE